MRGAFRIPAASAGGCQGQRPAWKGELSKVGYPKLILFEAGPLASMGLTFFETPASGGLRDFCHHLWGWRRSGRIAPQRAIWLRSILR
jgi:hypothetical protein